MGIGNYVLPVVIAIIILHGLLNGVNLFDSFLEGAKKGLQAAIKILPSLVGLITVVSMFKASGALDVLLMVIKPLAELIGIPGDVMPLAILRPVSGGGSLALFESILQQHGPDSVIGRIASVMMGSSETTFYAISIYFGSVGIRKTRQAVPAALLADLTGCIVSSYLILYFGL